MNPTTSPTPEVNRLPASPAAATHAGASQRTEAREKRRQVGKEEATLPAPRGHESAQRKHDRTPRAPVFLHQRDHLKREFRKQSIYNSVRQNKQLRVTSPRRPEGRSQKPGNAAARQVSDERASRGRGRRPHAVDTALPRVTYRFSSIRLRFHCPAHPAPRNGKANPQVPKQL